MRPLHVLIATASCALLLAACGSEEVSVSASEDEAGAEIFAANCGGCHTLTPAGTQGSGNRALRAQGPNFDQRVETYDDALFAIRNGGFSGAIMPQNIVVGEDAELVAQFIADYSGGDVEEAPRPTSEAPSAEDPAPDAGDQAEAQGGSGGQGQGGQPE